MQRKPDQPGFQYREPETQESLHRPQGKPQPRETKSQQAQLNSIHRHGTNKAIKTNMHQKTNLNNNENKH